MNYSKELLRTIVVKYPQILGRNVEEIKNVYTILEREGVRRNELTKLLFECPKLFTIELEKNMEEIFHLFDLYHKISREEVMGVFKKFPYLFCCDLNKIRLFMASFRKYRLSNERILHLVSRILVFYSHLFSALIQVAYWLAKSQILKDC